ncbi:hypothetical protein [Sphingomonas rosea]|uniref:hypothetical protein n=1 Tax=Sphingomonas rosea TaxID=335605 RepID=UPI0031E3B031
MARHQNFGGELGKEVVAAFDQGRAAGDERLLGTLWQRIESLPLSEQGSQRTLLSLLRPDEPLDSHLAEYLIGWASDENVPPSEIEAAFR